MKCVVLAAGEGVRLQPITVTRPKHLIKIGGKTILEYCLNALKISGINEVVIVTHYRGDAIHQYFGNGKRSGLKVGYVEQKAVLGTGNAVGAVEPYVDDDFLVVYGDLLFAAKIVKNIIELYKKERPAAVMTVVPVKKPENYGIVELENEKYVRRIIEKPLPEESPSNWANAGVYVFSRTIFEKIRRSKASIRGEVEITDAISLLLQDKKLVLTVKTSSDDWIDVGRPWDLLDANRWALRRMKHKILGVVENNAHLIGPVTVAETARIRSGAYIEGPTFIDEGSDIGPNCFIRAFTSIGRNVRIGSACEIKNSIIMDKTHIGHLSYVGDSIICENCNFGAGTITANYRFDSETIKMRVKDEVVDSGRIKLGVILGDNVKTGINALFMPGVKVWNNCCVGPNFIVRRDLPTNTTALSKQDLKKCGNKKAVSNKLR